MKTFLYSIHRLDFELSKIKFFFNHLPLDKYLDGKYRKRRYSKINYHHRHWRLLTPTSFTQSSEYNPYLGDVERKYDPLQGEVIEAKEFIAILDIFKELTLNFTNKPTDPFDVGVHFIRIECGADVEGLPVPEGIHRDGFKSVMILCVSRNNIQGGVSQIYKSKAEMPILEYVLEESEFIFLNDKILYHNATPIETEGGKGYRDAIVITH